MLTEFTRLREEGIVRLIHLLIVSRSEDGTLETLEAPEATAADLGDLAAGVLSQPEDASPVQTDADTSTRLGCGPLLTPYRSAVPLPSRSSSTSGPILECGNSAGRGHPAGGNLAGSA